MKHELIEALSGALFALALLGLEKFLPFNEPYNILAACALGAVGFALFFALAWRFRHSKLMRNFGDDLHWFVGHWLEVWHDGASTRYSIATVRFEDAAKQYVLIGDSYDEHGVWKAHWTSHCLHYDGVNARLVYISDGHEIGGRMAFGATCFMMGNAQSQNGRGFFVDDSSGTLSRFDFQFSKLEDVTWETDPTAWVIKQHALRCVAVAAASPKS